MLKKLPFIFSSSFFFMRALGSPIDLAVVANQKLLYLIGSTTME